MEIHQMLCLSTAHLTFSTRSLLDQDATPGAIFFPKDCYGWFMYVPPSQLLAASAAEPPEDVSDCIAFASKRGVQWLMFDIDGPTIDELPLYDEASLGPMATQPLNQTTTGVTSNGLLQPLPQD